MDARVHINTATELGGGSPTLGRFYPKPVWTQRSEEKSPPFRYPGSNPGRLARSLAAWATWSTSILTSQLINWLLRNVEIRYRSWISPPLVPSLSKIYPVSTYFKSFLISYSQPRLGHRKDLFPSGFPTKILYAFPITPCVLYISCLFQSSRLMISNYVRLRI